MKKYLLLCLSLVLILFMVGCNSSKGGEDAPTAFDANSTKAQITYNNKTMTLTGDRQKDFVSLVKNIYKGADAKVDSATKYNMKIDFSNGNIGEISTDKKVFKFQNDVKKISDDDLNELLEYVN